MYIKAIKAILQKLEAVPENLLELYLQKRFDLSESLSKQSIHSALRSNACFRANDHITRAPVVDMNSMVRKKGELFRLIISFLPDSEDFICGQNPWLVSFIKSGKLVQVCYIERDNEMIASRMIADTPVPLTERDFIRRIAIVEKGSNVEKIKRCGISHICSVGKSYEIENLEARGQEIAWDDVPDA